MKPEEIYKDPAFPVMAMDILGNVLSRADNPGDLGTYLTEEVRDLTGARCVLLIQCLCTEAASAHRVVSVNPLRRREWAESPAGNRLYEVVHRLPAAQLWRGEEPAEVAGLLRREGFELSMVFPLNAGKFRVGAMLVLGLPDEEHITSVLSLLNNLSAIVALELRNAILYEKQEQLVREWTAELRENNEKLAMELAERKRAERDNALMNFALDNVHEAAFLIDENARFNYVNEYVCHALGYSRDELLGLGVPDVDPDFPSERWPSHWDDLKTRGSLTFEGRHKAKDGSIFPVEVNANYFEYEGRGYNLALVRDITERKRAEQERLAHLRFLESLDWINQAIQGTNYLEQMMSDVLDVVLSIFDCDRAFLMYPCDPEAAMWRTPMERTRPEYPGVLALGLVMPMAENVMATLRILLDSAGPVQFGPGTEHPLPADVSERFGFKSFMSIALRPKLGKPWQFGIHQCSYPRIWTPDEEKLLQEIGRRLSDGLTSLLAYRDLQENERKLRVALQIGHIGAFAVDIESGRGTFTPELTEFWGMPGDFTGDFLSFCWEHVHPEELPGTKEAFARMVQSRKEGGMEFRIIRPDGELRWLHWQGQVIQDAAGGPLRAVGVNIDITERKRAEEALKRLNEELEQRVKQRTVELETKNAELARLNKVFVGRELRMAELKERIRELEKTLKQPVSE